jgi:Type III restriction enzyme, res subunit
MPTGTGKTKVALAIMELAALSTQMVAPVRDLMYKWHRRILLAVAGPAKRLMTEWPTGTICYNSVLRPGKLLERLAKLR